MNGNESNAEAILEDVEDVTESDELEVDEAIAEGEAAEFFPFLPFLAPGLFGGGPRRAQVARARPYYMPRPLSNFVTQPQLQGALARVRNDVGRNARAITAVNTRVNGLQAISTRHGRELVKQRSVNAQQAREIARVRTDLKNGLKKAQDNNMMLFLLTRPKATAAVGAGASVGTAPIPADHKILIQPEKDNTLLLALALSGGLGGDGGDSNMLLMVLALSGGLF